MEDIYANDETKCRLVKAKPETVRFLLDYSRSLHLTEIEGVIFESNKN